MSMQLYWEPASAVYWLRGYLADFYDRVGVVDRDLLPESPANRRGVPQGHHVHNLLGRGSQILGELFPESLTSSLQPECPSTTTKMFRAGP